MALTAGEMEEVRNYLGFSSLPDNDDNPRLESRLHDLSPTAEAKVRALLILLHGQDTALAANGTTLTSGTLKRVDEIEFYPATTSGAGASSGASAIANILATARMYVNQLSIATGVPKVGDWYGKWGYQGDGAYANSTFQMYPYF